MRPVFLEATNGITPRTLRCFKELSLFSFTKVKWHMRRQLLGYVYLFCEQRADNYKPANNTLTIQVIVIVCSIYWDYHENVGCCQPTVDWSLTQIMKELVYNKILPLSDFLAAAPNRAPNDCKVCLGCIYIASYISHS